MNKLVKNRQSGFTIIEVVLVLAIAGLIFLVVFLALPQLQKSQRDTERRSDVGRLVAGVTSYITNSNGDVPNDAGVVQTNVVDANYVEDDFPTKYYMWTSAVPANAAAAGAFGGNLSGDLEAVYYAKNANCTSGWIDSSGGSSRTFAVAVILEGGGTYCAEG